MQDDDGKSIRRADNWEVMDLVEPVSRPRFRDCVRNGMRWTTIPGCTWTWPHEDNDNTDEEDSSNGSGNDGDPYKGCPYECRYREWQLIGSDYGAGRPWGPGPRSSGSSSGKSESKSSNDSHDDEDNDGEDYVVGRSSRRMCDRVRDRILAAVLGTTTATKTTAGAEGENESDSSLLERRFRSFVMHDKAEHRFLWLSDSLFLVCQGPHAFLEDDDDDPGDCPKIHTAFYDWSFEGEAVTAGGGGGGTYELFLGDAAASAASAGDFARWYRGNDGERRHRDDGGWSPVLATLLALDDSRPTASVRCAMYDPRRFGDGHLEAIVSAAPTPSSSGRTLELSGSAESAARILAFRTHRETKLVADGTAWQGNLSVLAEAIRANQCPKRLVLLELRDHSVAAELCAAIGATTALEEVEVVDLPGAWSRPGPAFSVMLDAIRRNVGLASFAFGGDCQDGVNGRTVYVDAARMKDLWSSIFQNVTIERVSVQNVGADGQSDHDRSDCAMHVVRLLKANRSVTHIAYSPRTHDANIMESQAAPILYLNRLRRLVSPPPSDEENGPGTATTTTTSCDRFVPALLSKSSAVRRHPMLRYHLLRSCASAIAASSNSALKPGASNAAAAASEEPSGGLSCGKRARSPEGGPGSTIWRHQGDCEAEAAGTPHRES